MAQSYPVFYSTVRKRCGKNTSRYFRMERLNCFLLLIDLQRAIERQWKLPLATRSECLYFQFFFKEGCAGLREGIPLWQFMASLQRSFLPQIWLFCIPQKSHLDFFATRLQTWHEYHWSARMKVLDLCAEVNKGDFSVNLQLGRERWAEQSTTDCLTPANRDKQPPG